MTLLNAEPGVPKNVSVNEFRIEGDSLTINPDDPVARQVMRRVSGPYPAADSIVGEWSYQHSSGPMAFMRYARDGIVQLSVPMRSLSGTYRVNADVLDFELQGQGPTSSQFRREGRTLTLTDRAGKLSSFTKFDY